MLAHREQLGGVGLAFTDRRDGFSRPPFDSLNLGRTDVDAVEAVARNFTALAQHCDIERFAVVALNQQHTANVLTVTQQWLRQRGSEAGWRSALGTRGGQPALPVADALVSAEPAVALLIRVADCMPVILVDQRAGVIGAAHAGRVGLADGVLPATVKAMQALGAQAITARIGPHVCGACYEVPAELQATVAERVPGSASRTRKGAPALDLAAGAQRQLTGLGVSVRVVGDCTLESDELFSYRRDGADSGRLAGLVWRREL